MIFCRILNSHHNGLPDNKAVSSIVSNKCGDGGLNSSGACCLCISVWILNAFLLSFVIAFHSALL